MKKMAGKPKHRDATPKDFRYAYKPGCFPFSKSQEKKVKIMKKEGKNQDSAL